MTLWGKVVMPRRLYQADRGGPSRVPMDERCGMSGRFMVPELERVTAFLGARLVPAEVEDSLGEMLPESPSRTAIQHVLTTVGQCAEEGAEQLELALETAAPLNAEGDTLVVSWDDVTVPLREPAPKRGRPAERPMATDVDTAPTAWKEAGVGMVATYLTPLDPAAEEPQRIDVRYAARMPEAKMATLVNGLVDQTTRALQHGCFHERVVLADGKREIWRTVPGGTENSKTSGPTDAAPGRPHRLNHRCHLAMRQGPQWLHHVILGTQHGASRSHGLAVLTPSPQPIPAPPGCATARFAPWAPSCARSERARISSTSAPTTSDISLSSAAKLNYADTGRQHIVGSRAAPRSGPYLVVC